MNITYSKRLESEPSDSSVILRISEARKELFSKASGRFDSFEDFVSIPFSEYSSLNKNVVPCYEHLVFVGIGGSSLGPKALYNALFGYMDDVSIERIPKCHFIENVDFNYLDALMKNIRKRRNALCVVCKSGKTFEVVTNLSYIHDRYAKMFDTKDIFVVSEEGSEVWEWGKHIGANTYKIPSSVSGRFQVFSIYTLLLLRLLGIDEKSFITGACDTITNFIDVKQSILPSVIEKRYGHFVNGFTSDVYFAFDSRLLSLSNWYVSITAESLGKPNGGIFPVSNIGSCDCHSTVQLYLEGPKDKFTTFISLTTTDKSNIRALNAVKSAYDDVGLPYIHYILDASSNDIFVTELGKFMQSKILETVILGRLMGVNPFNQPGVELYKKYLS